VKKRWRPFAASIAYRSSTIRSARTKPGRASPAAAAPLLALALDLARRERNAVRRAGHRGGVDLFQTILDRPEGTLVTRHEFEDTWSFIRHPDGKIHLDVPEMLAALRALASEPDIQYPLVVIAGDRRAYNANQIYRDPAWRKVDPDGALRLHPDDAQALGLRDGSRALCSSNTGQVEVTIALDDALRRGVAVLPHGYGMRYRGGDPIGPQINRLTAAEHCDPLARTPFHKHVPITLRPLATA
jgi:anaerobic selenocysteine-containing dehydrogenase